MCLGVPGQVVEWLDRDPVMGRARVAFGGLTKVIQMACVPEVEPGDFVIVHAGIAIARVNPEEALRTLRDFQQIADLYADDPR